MTGTPPGSPPRPPPFPPSFTIIVMGAVSLLFLLAGGAAGVSQNMNGAYQVVSGADPDAPFNTDYASKGHEYFDVWAPEIATHYGEVFWTDQGVIDLPAEIIERFKGKTIAITGYEHDQVTGNLEPPNRIQI